MTKEITQRFNSKRDAWLAVFGFVAAAGAVIGITPILVQPVPILIKAIVFVLGLLTVVLIGWVFLGTYYEVGVDELVVTSGPFRWRIPISEIQCITPSRAPWSSPALSLDRLRIDYGEGKWILISPVQRKEFSKALGVPIDIS